MNKKKSDKLIKDYREIFLKANNREYKGIIEYKDGYFIFTEVELISTASIKELERMIWNLTNRAFGIKENYFVCLNCHQQIISREEVINKCPKCKEENYVFNIIHGSNEINFKLNAITA